MTSNESIPFETVVVHPLVLLSVVDHFNRMKQVGNTRRVVGILLGSLRNKVLDISNSFAGKFDKILISKLYQIKLIKFCKVPFDEEDKDRDVWFFDHEYAENMYAMFKKVNGSYLNKNLIKKNYSIK